MLPYAGWLARAGVSRLRARLEMTTLACSNWPTRRRRGTFIAGQRFCASTWSAQIPHPNPFDCVENARAPNLRALHRPGKSRKFTNVREEELGELVAARISRAGKLPLVVVVVVEARLCVCGSTFLAYLPRLACQSSNDVVVIPFSCLFRRHCRRSQAEPAHLAAKDIGLASDGHWLGRIRLQFSRLTSIHE